MSTSISTLRTVSRVEGEPFHQKDTSILMMCNHTPMCSHRGHWEAHLEAGKPRPCRLHPRGDLRSQEETRGTHLCPQEQVPLPCNCLAGGRLGQRRGKWHAPFSDWLTLTLPVCRCLKRIVPSTRSTEASAMRPSMPTTTWSWHTRAPSCSRIRFLRYQAVRSERYGLGNKQVSSLRGIIKLISHASRRGACTHTRKPLTTIRLVNHLNNYK